MVVLISPVHNSAGPDLLPLTLTLASTRGGSTLPRRRTGSCQRYTTGYIQTADLQSASFHPWSILAILLPTRTLFLNPSQNPLPDLLHQERQGLCLSRLLLHALERQLSLWKGWGWKVIVTDPTSSSVVSFILISLLTRSGWSWSWSWWHATFMASVSWDILS